MSEYRVLAYEKRDAVCVPWDPRGPEVARIVKDMIERLLPEVEVEHIGSTAIPGCAGKGIVDLQILYPPSKLEMVKQVLQELGFQRQISRDPFPEDRPMRVGAIEYDGSVYRLHVHVVAATSSEVARVRAFRDRLIANARLRDEYVARKRRTIESGVTDTLDYTLEKGSFIQDVIADISE